MRRFPFRDLDRGAMALYMDSRDERKSISMEDVAEEVPVIHLGHELVFDVRRQGFHPVAVIAPQG